MLSLAVSPDGQTIATGGKENGIMLWDAANGKRKLTINVGEAEILALAYSPDGARLAASLRIKGKQLQGKILMIDPARGKSWFTIALSDVIALSLDFSPDGKLLAAGSYGDYGRNGAARTWDVPTGEPRAAFNDPQSRAYFYGEVVKFSPDGKLLAVSAHRNAIELWDVAAGKLLRTLSGHEGRVSALAFSPDGKAIASVCTKMCSIKFWDVESGQCTSTVQAKAPSGEGYFLIGSLSFSPDGKTLITGSKDRACGLVLWDVPSQHIKAIMFEPRQGEPVHGVAFLPRGGRAASIDRGSVQLWDVASYADTGRAEEALLARDPSLKRLYESLQTNRQEKELDLDSLSHFSDEHLAWLKDHQKLEKLTLIGAPLARFRKAFEGTGFQHLNGLPRLRELVLANMQIESFERLGQLQNVRVLRFSGTCQVPVEQWRHIGRMTALEELDLRGSCITDQGLSCLRTLQNLKVLRLNGTMLFDGRFHHFITTVGAENLKDLTSLEVLEMDGFRVGTEAGKYLVGLKNLRELDIGATSIDDGCAEAIANMPKLQKASLGTLTDKTIATIAAHPKLRSLYFSGRLANDADLQKLAASRSIQDLKIGGYWLPKAAIAYVRELPFMSRDERLTYGLLRYLLAEREALDRIHRMADEAPLLTYIPSPHRNVVSGEVIDSNDPRHPRHADYVASFREGVVLLGELKAAETGTKKRMEMIGAAALQAAERAFVDNPEKLKWAKRLIEQSTERR